MSVRLLPVLAVLAFAACTATPAADGGTSGGSSGGGSAGGGSAGGGSSGGGSSGGGGSGGGNGGGGGGPHGTTDGGLDANGDPICSPLTAPVALADLETAIIAAVVDRRIRCFGEARYLVELEADYRYRASGDILPDLRRTIRGAQTGRSQYDAAKGRDCVNALRCYPCGGFDWRRLASVYCKEAFTGTVPVGGVCYAAPDCLSGNCDFNTTDCPALCGPPLARFEKCEETSRCPPDTRCFNTYCQPLGTPDAGCTASLDCAPGFTCRGWACTAFADAGESCHDRACRPDEYCRTEADVAQKRCVPRLGEGSPCVESGTAPAGEKVCEKHLVCRGVFYDGQSLVLGRCARPAQEGQSCTPVDQATVTGCARGLACMLDGGCALPPTTGPAAPAHASYDEAACKQPESMARPQNGPPPYQCFLLGPVGASCPDFSFERCATDHCLAMADGGSRCAYRPRAMDHHNCWPP